jgi:hypothetical protein
LIVEGFEYIGPQAADLSAQVSPPGVPDGGLSPGQSFKVDVSLKPGDGGEEVATLVIETNGGDATIAFDIDDGPDIPPCQFVISPTSLDFGDVQVGSTSAPLSFQVQNVGTNVCRVKGLAVEDDDAGAFHLLSTSIAPDPDTQLIAIPAPATGVDSNLSVTLDFAPTVEGRVSAQAAFSISDPSDPNPVVPLSGASL